MTWGIPTHLFLQIHVAISLIALVAGLVVLFGLLKGRALGGWMELFLVTIILTSVTGFPLPPFGLDPPRMVGILSLVLLAIAVVNIVILRGVWRSFKKARRGEPVLEDELNMLLAGRGFLARLFRPLFSMVTRSWQMFPVGFLFGLGFDTATEISLFAVAASQASGGMSFSTVMIFPALFTAGMTLLDTTDSVLMVGAYGWAFLNPIRKLWYNLTITSVSVLVAPRHASYAFMYCFQQSRSLISSTLNFQFFSG